MGHRSVGVGATYNYYDHHMERIRFRLLLQDFGKAPPLLMLRPPVSSFVKPDFREPADSGLGFSRRLVVWDLSKGGRPLAKPAHTG